MSDITRNPATSSQFRSRQGLIPRLLNAVMPRVRPFQEMGVSGTPVYAGYVLSPEKSSKLIGQEKHRTYAEMLANISIIAAGVRYFLNVVSRPEWSAEAPEDSGDEGQMYVDFVNEVLMEDLHTPWNRVVRRAGNYRFHGFNVQEWTAVKRDDGRIGFDDIESRPQWTIWRWEVDDQGTVTGVWQRDPLTGREMGLPRGKIMYLVDDTLTDAPDGMGLLRHCYEPTKRLEEYLKQESYGYLRDLQGIPLGRAPIDEMAESVATGRMTQAQMNEGLQRLKDIVTLERKTSDTGIILNSQPYVNVSDGGVAVSGAPKWNLELISGAASGLVPINQAIVRLTTEIARILGVEHLLLGADAEGSYALAKEKARDMYLLANSVLRDIREQATHDLLWPLWSLNGFPDEMMPELKSEDVAPKDVEQISRVMREIAVSGAPMQPDDEAINVIRDLLGIPHLDLEKIGQQMQDMAALQVQQQQMNSSNPYDQDMGEVGAAGQNPGGAPPFQKFDPNQPRDEAGRWTDTGGGGADDDFDEEEVKSYQEKPRASAQKKAKVEGVFRRLYRQWSEFEDSRPVLASVVQLLGSVAFNVLLYLAFFKAAKGLAGSINRSKWQRDREAYYRAQGDRARAESARRNQRAYEEYRSGRGGRMSTATLQEDPAAAAVRRKFRDAKKGARAAAAMTLYLKGSTPGEKAAAEAALQRMGIDPKKFKKSFFDIFKAGNPFEALDELLTNEEAKKILDTILENLSEEDAEKILEKFNDMEKAGVWDETKHPRDKGRFASKPGAGAAPKTQPNGKGDQEEEEVTLEDHTVNLERHAEATHSVSDFMRKNAPVIAKAVKNYVRDNGLTLAAETVVSVVVYKMMTRFIGGMIGTALGGPAGAAVGVIAANVVSDGISQMIDAAKRSAGVSDRDAWGLLQHVTSELYKSAKSTLGIADEKKTRTKKAAPNEEQDQPELENRKDGNFNTDIVKILEAMLAAFEKLKLSEPDEENMDEEEAAPKKETKTADSTAKGATD